MWLGVFAGLSAGALWALAYLFPLWVPQFSALEQVVMRYFIIGLISLGICAPRWRALRSRLTSTQMWALLRLALTGNVLYSLLVVVAVQKVGVAPTSLIVGVLPISIVLAGFIVNAKQAQQIHMPALVIALLLISAGIFCINVDLIEQARALSQPINQIVFGLLAAFGALLSWTYFAVANTQYLQKHQHFSSHEWNNLMGIFSGIAVLPGLAFMVWFLPEEPVSRSWGYFLALSVLIALVTFTLGSALWNLASRYLPLTLSGQLIVSETLFALLYGFLYAGRWPRTWEWLAILLLIVGVLLAIHSHRKNTVSAH